MSLDKDDIRKVARLARLAVNETEVTKYVTEITNTLELIANLNQANTENVAPMAHPLNCAQRLRADIVTELDQRAKFQKIAPHVAAGLYLVPKVIE